MENFLRNIKLIDDFTTEINISKSEFISRLKRQVDESSLGVFSDFGDVFSSSKNEYKGVVNYDGFKFKRKRRFFDTKMNVATVSGNYRQVSDTLIIESQITGFTGIIMFFFIFAMLIYTVFIMTFIFGTAGGDKPFYMIPFIALHALLMFGIPYFIVRRSVKRFKYDLEREFHYIASKPLNS
ncbi:hypothetical protein [Psychroserpens algicola]|uniref:GTP-binding protein n=1 Tax=Psychroserpens algicola TaxID=1719034 RepID=A0ABT0H8P2_9FLAO|nr:hypothetical protein [Psychroserpens algicola]MCK8480739.1 hypothetical protein [Psychroserpens algicola]